MTDPGRPDAEPLPTGTVTFLRTDVEGSMELTHRLGARWDEVNARHLACIRDAVGANGGVIVRTEGDAVFAAFDEAGAAVRAAVDAQRRLAAEPWPDRVDLRVRMGLHSGAAHLAGDDYGGLDVSRAARVAASAHGGQIIASGTTAALVADRLPDGVTLRDLGEHRLRDVPRPERLIQLEVAGLPGDFPPPRTGGQIAGDLPDRLTSFIGREREIEAIREQLLGTAHIVTLTGPGGVGKSSLAIEAARAMQADIHDGCWFVSLADVTTPDDVTAAIAHGIGLRDGPERSASTELERYVADRGLLVVLDNMEQVVDAAPSVARFARWSPGSRVLVTSRAPLHIAGEHELPVSPLVDDAATLFVERARAVRPGWTASDDGVIEEICELVDGLPLGIELAAARVALLPPAVIRDRLAARALLPGPGLRDVPERQRTLDAAVAWSHDLLDPDLQALLHVLGVFEGGFDLEEVDAVAGSGPSGSRLDDLLELADRSLIVPDPSTSGRVRHRLLRTIQSFAIARLREGGTEVAVRRRHAEAYIGLMARATPELYTSRHAAWLDRVGPEMGNLRSAVDSAIATDDGELALRLVAPMWRFWQAFGRTSEGRRLTEAALALPSAPTDGVVRAWAAAAAGSLAYWQADHTVAGSWYEEQVRLARAAGDDTCLADALFNLGHTRFMGTEEPERQVAWMTDVAGRYRALGDERGAARATLGNTMIAATIGPLDEARARFRHLLSDFERLDDQQYSAMCLAMLAWLAFIEGDTGTAARLTAENLRACWAMRDLATTAISLHTGVIMAVMCGRLEESAVVAGAFDAACERYGVRPPTDLERFIEMNDPTGTARRALGDETYEAAYARGREIELDEAVALVLELSAAAELAAAGAT
jgi:predicted ATPase/class 3 adenylate cyclase